VGGEGGDDAEAMTDEPKFGATGTYPRGQLGPHDEGGLTIGVARDNSGNVIVNFGTPVSWFGLPLEQAIAFGRLILKHAGAGTVEITIGGEKS
jgi:hypothetical protein